MRSAEQMHRAVIRHAREASVIVMAAAVADYLPVAPATKKIKRQPGKLTLELESTPDILADLARDKGDRILVGFAAETENVAEHARGKLQAKHADLIVANDVTAEGAGFDHDTNVVSFYPHDSDAISLPRMRKLEVAGRILDFVLELRRARKHHSRRTRGAVSHPSGSRPSDEIRKKLEERLRYYDDLRIGPYFRDRAAGGCAERGGAARDKSWRRIAGCEDDPVASTPATAQAAAAAKAREVTPMRPSAPTSLPVVQAPSLFGAVEQIEGDTLEAIRADMGECTRCRLHKQRNKIVFGAGNGKASLVFVGEGPGHDEDMQGLPFVGRAGKLLTQMIEAMGLVRDDVYICNIVKCLPAGESHSGKG